MRNDDRQGPEPLLDDLILLVDLVDWQSGEIVFEKGHVFNLGDNRQVERLLALYADEPAELWAIGYWLDIWSICTSLGVMPWLSIRRNPNWKGAR